MSSALVRYPEDMTGVNPNNHVTGEVRTLNVSQVRSVVTLYGPFFAESMVVHDNVTNALLERGVHYNLVDLVQDASLRFGKEVCKLILILDPAVSPTVRLDYQVLGGNYQYTAESIGQMFDTIMQDNRAVSWENVLGKQLQYPPTAHPHMLYDITGFGPLVVALQQVAESITLSNIPAFEAFIEVVLDRIKAATNQEILDMADSDSVMTLKQLLFATRYLNFNSITFRGNKTSLQLGSWVNFTISATNFKPSEIVYWTLRSAGGYKPEYFAAVSGMVNVQNQEGAFNVVTATGTSDTGVSQFVVELRRNSIQGPVFAESGPIILVIPDGSAVGDDGTLSGGVYEGVCCLMRGNIEITAESYFLVTTHPEPRVLTLNNS